MKTNICCVIVTFNRLELLKECIESVKSQSRGLDKIIIVNNGSTDGTNEYLESILCDDIEVVSQQNLGGAGGFHTGVKIAYEQGFDWIWMMDDDVEVDEYCLENLLKYSHISECLHPNKIYIDGENFDWEHWYDAIRGNTVLGYRNYSFKNGKDICFVNAGCFEGMLISRQIVDKIGFPNKKYFISGDDLEYGFLASQFTNVSYVKKAKIIRKKKSTDEVQSAISKYYSLRNRHLLKELPKLSNLEYTIGKTYEVNTFKLYYNYMRSVIMDSDSKLDKLKNMRLVTSGYLDYFRKRTGKKA